MSLSVEDRLAALRNRLQKRVELATALGDSPQNSSISLDDLIKRIQQNTRGVFYPTPNRQLDEA